MAITVPVSVRVLLPDGRVEEMKLETYLAGAVAAEIGANAPLEALKAQAIASRTYVAAAQRHLEHNADVCTTAHCQRWKPVDPVAVPEIFRALSETWGMVAIYDGKLINAFFFEHCDGRTRNSEEMLMPSLPYLRGVACSCGFLHLKGHGVGMCKRGAIVMARRGASYEQILRHYYRGVVVIHTALEQPTLVEPLSVVFAPTVEAPAPAVPVAPKKRARVRKVQEPDVEERKPAKVARKRVAPRLSVPVAKPAPQPAPPPPEIPRAKPQVAPRVIAPASHPAPVTPSQPAPVAPPAPVLAPTPVTPSQPAPVAPPAPVLAPTPVAPSQPAPVAPPAPVLAPTPVAPSQLAPVATTPIASAEPTPRAAEQTPALPTPQKIVEPIPAVSPAQTPTAPMETAAEPAAVIAPAPRVAAPDETQPAAPSAYESSSVIARRVHVDYLPGERMIAGCLPRAGVAVSIEDARGNKTLVFSGNALHYGEGGFEAVVAEDGRYLVTIGRRVIEVNVQGETAFIHAD